MKDAEKIKSSIQMHQQKSVNSNIPSVARIVKSGYDRLPKELNEMKIGDDKGKNNNEKVYML